MTQMISVRACPGGWLVEGDEIRPTLYFRSGGRAESAARDLAKTAATSGRTVEVRVFDLSGRLAGIVHAA